MSLNQPKLKTYGIQENLDQMSSLREETQPNQLVPQNSARLQTDNDNKSLYKYNRDGPPKQILGDIMDDQNEQLQGLLASNKLIQKKTTGDYGTLRKLDSIQITEYQSEQNLLKSMKSPQYSQFKNFANYQNLRIVNQINPVEVSHPKIFNMRGTIQRKIYIFFHILNACVGSFLFGYYLVSFNSINGTYRVQNRWLDNRVWVDFNTLVTAAFPFGALISTKFMWVPRDRLFQSYRTFFLTIDFLTIVVGIGMLSSTNTAIIVSTRFLMGAVLAMNTNIIPTYIREISKNILPDFVNQLNLFGVSIGIYICAGTSFWQRLYYVQLEQKLVDDFVWRGILTFPLICTLARSFFTAFILKKDIKNNITDNLRTDEMASFYEPLYRRKDYMNTLKQFIEQEEIEGLRDERIQKSFLVQDTFNPFQQSFARRALLAIFIGFGSEMTGLSALLLFSLTMFNQQEPDKALGKHVAVACGSIVAHFLALFILKFFRKWRKVFLVGVLILIIPLYTLIDFDRQDYAIATFWCLAVFLCGYWISYGYLENEFLQYTMNLRHMYIFQFSKYLGLFAVSLSTPIMVYKTYVAGTFAIYASITIIFAVYIGIQANYTVGLSQYQIALSYLFEDQKPQIFDHNLYDPLYGEYDYQSKLHYLKLVWKQSLLEKVNLARIGFPLDKTIQREL